METDFAELFSARSGHFLFESRHHGDQWLELESLYVIPERVRPFTTALADRVRALQPEMVCGPLVEGAFVGLMVASCLNVEFVYTERIESEETDGLYPVKYRVPDVLRSRIQGKQVLIINDVINAGSAVSRSWEDLVESGGEIIGVGALLVLGDWASTFTQQKGVALQSIDHRPNRIWTESECPLCHAGIALQDPGGFRQPQET